MRTNRLSEEQVPHCRQEPHTTGGDFSTAHTRQVRLKRRAERSEPCLVIRGFRRAASEQKDEESAPPRSSEDARSSEKFYSAQPR
jgi:hypothetical protein